LIRTLTTFNKEWGRIKGSKAKLNRKKKRKGAYLGYNQSVSRHRDAQACKETKRGNQEKRKISPIRGETNLGRGRER